MTQPYITPPAPTKKARGRPKKLAGDTVHFNVRLTVEDRDKLDRLGGGDWLRAKIQEAPEPLGGSRARAAWIGNVQEDGGA